jgi:CRISPR/Cas system-associated protein Cas10 (large subunit of type III CRISPR-Cas system)
MIENDTWYRCNICGREGRVGRCCSDEDRTPLNALAKAEQERTDKRKKVKQFEKKY